MVLEPPVNVAVVDDHVLTRQVLRDVIRDWPHGSVVLEAGNGLEYEAAIAGGAIVHVAIVDLSMPVRDGYETIEWIVENQPGVRIMALTHEPTDEQAYRAMAAGAHTILHKGISQNELFQVLDDIRTSGYHVNDLVQRQISHKPDAGSKLVLRKKARDLLSPQQLRFLLHYIGEDHPTIKQVAGKMAIEEKTAEGYRRDVVEKVGVSKRTELYKFAVRFGLMP